MKKLTMTGQTEKPVVIMLALVSENGMMKCVDLDENGQMLDAPSQEMLETRMKSLIKGQVDLKKVYSQLMKPVVPSETPAAAEAADDEHPFIARIIHIVNENLQNREFGVKMLADVLHTSQPTLYRKVKKLTNITIVELIRCIRLKNAAELLRTRKYSVRAVAELVGYYDMPTFRRHFVDFFGSTPSTYHHKEVEEYRRLSVV